MVIDQDYDDGGGGDERRKNDAHPGMSRSSEENENQEVQGPWRSALTPAVGIMTNGNFLQTYIKKSCDIGLQNVSGFDIDLSRSLRQNVNTPLDSAYMHSY